MTQSYAVHPKDMSKRLHLDSLKKYLMCAASLVGAEKANKANVLSRLTESHSMNRSSRPAAPSKLEHFRPKRIVRDT